MKQPSWRNDKRTAAERGYGSKWQKARASYLAANPVCCRCETNGRIVAATVVNHRVPHKGDRKLFWDRKNWEPVCKPCHDGTIQREERSGFVTGTGRDGRPLDPSHPWNVKSG